MSKQQYCKLHGLPINYLARLNRQIISPTCDSCVLEELPLKSYFYEQEQLREQQIKLLVKNLEQCKDLIEFTKNQQVFMDQQLPNEIKKIEGFQEYLENQIEEVKGFNINSYSSCNVLVAAYETIKKSQVEALDDVIKTLATFKNKNLLDSISGLRRLHDMQRTAYNLNNQDVV